MYSGFLQMYVLFAITVTTIMCLPALRTAPQRCPLNNGNLLDVVLFVENEEQCKQKCRTEEKCIFYFFYEGISFIYLLTETNFVGEKPLKIT